MVGSPSASDVSSLSSVSSNELEVMMERESGDNIKGQGESSSEKKQRGSSNKAGSSSRGNTRSSGGRVEDLTCKEGKFPSDSEEGSEVDTASAARKSNARWMDMIKLGSQAPKGMQSGGGSEFLLSSRGASQSYSSQAYTSRATPVMFSSDFTFAGSRSVPRPLGCLKGTTVSRVNGNILQPLIDDNSGGRKRRPRLEASLRFCRDFINEISLKKHKDWVWPFLKLGRDVLFKDPISLQDLKNKLEDRLYSNSQEFEEDFKKMIQNYRCAYSSNHQNHQSAVKLLQLYEEFKTHKSPRMDSFAKERLSVATARPVGRPRSEGSTNTTNNALAKMAADLRGMGGSRESAKCVSGNGNAVLGNVPVDLSQQFTGCPNGGQPWAPWVGQEIQKAARPGSDRDLPSNNSDSVVVLANTSPSSSNVNEDNRQESQGNGDSGIAEVNQESSEEQNDSSEAREKSKSSSVAGCSTLSTPSKRNAQVEGAEAERNEKRARVARVDEVQSLDQSNCNICLVNLDSIKQEFDWENDPTPPLVTRTRATASRSSLCKWLYDGINMVAAQGQENVMSRIKRLIDVGEQETTIELGMVERLSDDMLEDLNQILFNFFLGRRERATTSTTTTSARETEDTAHADALRIVVNDAISDYQTDWNATQQFLASIQSNTYETLKTINRLQEQSFENLKKLHILKGSIQSTQLG